MPSQEGKKERKGLGVSERRPVQPSAVRRAALGREGNRDLWDRRGGGGGGGARETELLGQNSSVKIMIRLCWSVCGLSCLRLGKHTEIVEYDCLVALVVKLMIYLFTRCLT